MITKTKEPALKERNFALFDLAFRPLFLCGSIFSIVAIFIWAGIFSGHLHLNVFGGGLW
tara:strand:- start:3594 stop:3770 length:177 start_codon:yes stop_codon:yes gene_type:complete